VVVLVFTRELPIEPVVDEPNIFVVVLVFTRELPIEPVVDEPNIFVVVLVFTRELPIEPVVVEPNIFVVVVVFTRCPLQVPVVVDPNIFVVVVVLHEAWASIIPIDIVEPANKIIVPILTKPCNFMTRGYTALLLPARINESSLWL
jgi:hypothetical protein